MKQHELTRFLRFVTGSSVLINEGIKVVFNNLTGAARRPISHTCSCSLELPLSYTTCTFPEFEAEFTKVLLDDAWLLLDNGYHIRRLQLMCCFLIAIGYFFIYCFLNRMLCDIHNMQHNDYLN